MNKNQRWIHVALMLGFFSPQAACDRTTKEVPFKSSTVDSHASVEELSFDLQLADVNANRNRTITVTHVTVSATQLEQLQGVSNLQTLHLDCGLDEPESIFKLPRLDSLTHLRIRSSPIRDDGLLHIVHQAPNLSILNIPVADLTHQSRHVLENLTRLTSLRIGGKCVNRSFLEQLQSLPKLHHLHLISPKLVDEDLQMIASLKSLQSFYLDDCNLSDAAWECFFETRPNLHVHLDQFHHDLDPKKHPHL